MFLYFRTNPRNQDKLRQRDDLQTLLLAYNIVNQLTFISIPNLKKDCPAIGGDSLFYKLEPSNYFSIFVTTPAPTVLPPSRIANLPFSSKATGVISLIVTVMVSPGITISVPSGKVTSPVTSVVRT